MKRSIVVEAKKVEDAISQALKVLNVTIDEAEVKVLSSGGFLKKAKIEMTVGSDDDKEEVVATSIKVVEAKQEPKAEVKQEVKQELKAEVKQEVKQELKADVKQEVKQEPKAEVKQEVKQEAKPKKVVKKDGKKPRKLDIVTAEQKEQVDKFVTDLVKLMGIEGTISSTIADSLELSIDTNDSSIIGHHGETLDAIQYLSMLVLNAGNKGYSHVDIDAMQYRAKRIQTLKDMAQRMADECLEKNSKVALKPMNSAERKVVHAYLSENDKVITRSEGNEPKRRLVIYPVK